MHGIQANVGHRRLKLERREQVLVAAEDVAPGGKQIAVLEQSERVARNVRLEREGDFAAGQDVHRVEAEVRSRREGADRSKQVGIAFDGSTGSGDEVTSLDYMRGFRSGSRFEITRSREPDFAHGRSSEAQ